MKGAKEQWTHQNNPHFTLAIAKFSDTHWKAQLGREVRDAPNERQAVGIATVMVHELALALEPTIQHLRRQQAILERDTQRPSGVMRTASGTMPAVTTSTAARRGPPGGFLTRDSNN